MSAAALPPINGVILPADRQHPRFREYQTYRSSCARLMIDCPSFRNWLSTTERQERDDEWAKHPQYPAFLAWMRQTRGGARATSKGKLCFPENFKLWLEGERW